MNFLNQEYPISAALSARQQSGMQMNEEHRFHNTYRSQLMQLSSAQRDYLRQLEYLNRAVVRLRQRFLIDHKIRQKLSDLLQDTDKRQNMEFVLVLHKSFSGAEKKNKMIINDVVENIDAELWCLARLLYEFSYHPKPLYKAFQNIFHAWLEYLDKVRTVCLTELIKETEIVVKRMYRQFICETFQMHYYEINKYDLLPKQASNEEQLELTF